VPDGENRGPIRPGLPITEKEADAIYSMLLEEVSGYSRGGFQRVLASLLEASPSPARIKQWASHNPNKWAQMVKIFALLSGYTEKTESIITLETKHIISMSDAELLTRLQQQATVAIPTIGYIEHRTTDNTEQPGVTEVQDLEAS
jgi:hypothetical protein